MIRRLFLVLLLPLALAGCGAERIWAPDAEVARAHVSFPGPKYVKLVTVISTRTGAGAHTGLVVNDHERLLFDPAGTFKHPNMPERNDVLYGVTDQRLEIYYDYHARITFYVDVQTKQVSTEVADMIAARIKNYGAVPKAHCAQAVSRILHGVPGFESIGVTWMPKRLMHEFAQLGGVNDRKIYDSDSDDNRYVIYTHPDDPNAPGVGR